MKQSLVKVVDAILKRIEEHPEVPSSEHGIRVWLARQGFKKRDIEAAMKLVKPHFGDSRRVDDYRPGPVRALSIAEEQKLTPEARTALIRLEYYDLISPYERESILERMYQFDGPVGLDELDYLLSWLVCNGRDYETQHTIYSVFEGEGKIFH